MSTDDDDDVEDDDDDDDEDYDEDDEEDEEAWASVHTHLHIMPRVLALCVYVAGRGFASWAQAGALRQGRRPRPCASRGFASWAQIETLPLAIFTFSLQGHWGADADRNIILMVYQKCKRSWQEKQAGCM